jgi:hypothetical protein
MCLPAGRFFTIPFPPGLFAARRLAAVILPPLLFFAILNASLNCLVSVMVVIYVSLSYGIDAQYNLGQVSKDTLVHDTPLSHYFPKTFLT